MADLNAYACLPDMMLRKIDFSDADNCWLWTGACYLGRGAGYGRVTPPPGSGWSTLVHRRIWQQVVGPIPVGMTVDHECHNRDLSCAGGVECSHRRCVRVDHLELRTPSENVRAARMYERPRSKVYRESRHECPAGHDFAATAYWSTDGKRRCRECNLDAKARYRARRSGVPA